MTTLKSEILKVSGTSKPALVAGSIAHGIRASQAVDMHCVGAGAVNQAVKAVAIARGYLAPAGIDIYVQPCFVDFDFDGEHKTGLNLQVRTFAP